MRKLITIVAVSFMLSGCAAGLRVDQISDVDSSEKVLVLMNETKWNVKLRRELAKQGFQVKRFTSLKEVEIKEGKRTETFNLAEARYGLTVVPGTIVDWCLGGRAKKFGDFAVEITDLRTNDLVMVVEQGGWSDTCMGLFGNLFPDIAKALRQHWK
jgi:hypothetical protein